MDDDDDQVTDEKRAEWRHLTDAATPGPWRAGSQETWHVFVPWRGIGLERVLLRMNDNAPEFAFTKDAAFIAAARQAMPMLLDYVEQLQAQHIEALDNWSEQETRAERAEKLCVALAASVRRAIYVLDDLEDTVLDEEELCEGLPSDWREQVRAMVAKKET